MNLLIDTHALIWFIDDDKKLPEKIKDDIENINNKCFVSIASIWEMGIKHSLKKLELKKDLQEIINLIELTFDILPLTSTHIIQQSNLKFHHRDPFDRILIAQSQIEGLSIITNDKAFPLYNVSLWWS